jgi:hypothetical protein
VTDLQLKKRVYSGRPNADGTYFFYIPEGSEYELSVDPEQSHITFFSKYFDLREERKSQKEKINVELKKPEAGDAINLDLVQFKPFSSELDDLAQQELNRFVRFATANPDLNFEIHVTLHGFRQDTVRSSEDLTETRTDSTNVVQPADSTSVAPAMNTVYHNDRTLKQAEAINAYLINKGMSVEQIQFVVNALPGEEDEPKLEVVAVVK